MLLSTDETYVSFDIETDGQLPGVNSMLSLGAAAFNSDGQRLNTWYSNIMPVSSCDQDEETMRWWSKQPKEIWDSLLVDQKTPITAMKSFDQWLTELPGNKVLMANPAAWDGMFLNWYSYQYLGRYLETKHRVLDIRSFTMGALGGGFLERGRDDLREIFKEITARNTTQHNALSDAIEQGEQFFAVVNLAKYGSYL